MFVSRFLRSTFLLAAARTEASATAAAAGADAVRKARNPLEELFEVERRTDDEKPVIYGRSWKACELRLKSWDDLSKLWYVLLKEKNMLLSQRQMLQSQNLYFPNPERISKVKKSMCRIKHVLTERAIAEPDPRRCAEMKKMINSFDYESLIANGTSICETSILVRMYKRECGMQSSSSCEDSDNDDDDVCAVCLDRLCDVAAQGCEHELCIKCALNLCSTMRANNSAEPPGTIPCPLCRASIQAFRTLPAFQSKRSDLNNHFSSGSGKPLVACKTKY